MQRARTLYGAIFALACASGVASAEDQPRDSQQTARPTEVRAIKLRTVATVEQVDVAKRKVTLKSDQGAQFKMAVPKNVEGLENLKKGDQVDVEYFSTMTLSLERPGEKSETGETTVTERVPGPLPSGAVAQRISATFEIVKVHKGINAVTLRSPNGELDTIHVTDPGLRSDLTRLKAGDKVHAEYTEAVAISIAPRAAK